MPEKLVQGETPVEFFREQLLKAMDHQRVATSAFTESYLVNLLAACLRGEILPGREPGYDETPLALLYLRALAASRHERARLLRAMGDTALFVSGFFADSLHGRVADASYYCALGGRAYASLSREHEQARGFGPAVFSELAGRFRLFADVLSEVSEASQLSTPASLLRLYERWLQTGSRRAAALLAERGITPLLPGEGRLH
ncbi:MAG TPA: hypothetical protein VN461_16645 [Vicinamibacteria bacterium]|nr:hypothetical protein [Vicinamibacteria bacterium]